jgi:hypothetical protein
MLLDEREVAMGAPIQRLWHHVSYWPFLSIFWGHEPVLGPTETPDKVVLGTVAVTFKECEGVCEPTAEQIEAKERERADRFKGDQLLPIMGFGGGSPSPPS